MKSTLLSTLAWLLAAIVAVLLAWTLPPDAMLESFGPSAFDLLPSDG